MSPQLRRAVAPDNSLRELIKHLDRLSDKDIIVLKIPTGTPLVCELTDELTPIRSYYLDGRSFHETGRSKVKVLAGKNWK